MVENCTKIVQKEGGEGGAGFESLYPLSPSRVDGVSVWDGENCYTAPFLCNRPTRALGPGHGGDPRNDCAAGASGLLTGKLLHLHNFGAVGAG